MRTLVAVLAIGSFGCPAAPSAPAKEVSKVTKIDAEGLVVELRAKGPYVEGGPVVIEMTVRNPTEAPKTFCRYHTPFEGLRNDIFSISASIADVEYRGVMAKRAPPGPEDYITLAPGESKTATVDLAEGYQIPPGGYALSYSGTSISGLPISGPTSLSIQKKP